MAELKKLSELKYYFNPPYYVFAAGAEMAFLGKYLTALARLAEEDGDEIWVTVSDLARMLSPQMSLRREGDELVLTDETRCLRIAADTGVCRVTGADPADNLAARRAGEEWLLPVCRVMQEVFDRPVVKRSPWYVFGRAGEELAFGRPQESHYLNVLRGKTVGEVYRTVWNEDVQKLLPCHLYIPTYYQEREALPLVIALHGGMGSADSVFDNTQRKFTYYAEKMGFILMAPDACVFDSNYGCLVPPEGARKDGPIDFTVNEQSRWEKKTAESALLQEIAWVRENWPIDPERIYLMGNSMGGIGTFHFASRHPELFRAISPAGAAPTAADFDSSDLAGLPICLVAGTEDAHGFDYIRHVYEVLRDRGLNIRFLVAGGGTHPSAWIDTLEETLTWLFAAEKTV
ncbi:MAG: dienelactone hydrolase family protein [Lachnospiraceae bacterium]|nr:dienelactone hydrolase family protein [Lachnospiraceae bacterium]